MGVRSRLAKVFGNTPPASMQAGEAASQMTPASPFSPGEPIGPYDGFQRNPRSHDFVNGYNIAARPRSHERVAFETLKGLVESYDVAQMCIWHRIDSIRSLDWSLIPAPGHDGDVSTAIPIGMAALAKPDRQTPFAAWLAEFLYDILAYDAGTLYRMRNRAGRAIGLRVVDGTTVAPLLDYWGNIPSAAGPGEPEPEAYVQYVQGLPWNWLTQSDLIYVPFRKIAGSPYGRAPLESILLNANTDLRFQAYFLQRFTEGNLPAAFASAPETWTPQQIEMFQTQWDAMLLGDQAVKSQVKWIPGGSQFAWSNEKDFSDVFSLFLMRKTAAAYHVVPSDLGFTENVNKSSGESQGDVQHRVGDLPLIHHVQSIISSFLQDDLGLPLTFAFDLGEEQADRLEQAQADKIYMELGVIGGSDIREMRYGLPEPDGQPMPRFVYTTRSGPIPLASLYAVAGQIDAETAAPEPGTQLPHTVFGGAEGVEPSPPIKNTPLAEAEYGPSAMPPAPPPQPVAKDGAPTTGITTGTGITSYDLVGQHDEDEEDTGQLAKAELAAFRAFRKGRVRAGRWRDFQFRAIDADIAADLNTAGRAAVEKASAGKGDAPAKGAPTSWPGWNLDEHCADHWAPLIAAALGGALTAAGAEQLTQAYLAEHQLPDGEADKDALTAAAIAWLATRGLDLATPLAPVLAALWTDGYLIGTASAHAAVDSGTPRLDGWTPGDTDTARQIIADAGASDTLNERLATAPAAAQAMADSRLRDLAKELATGLIAGTAAVALGAALRGKLSDLRLAAAIAITEVTGSSSAAALFGYQLLLITETRWAIDPSSKVCPVCTGNAGAGAVRLGAAYPSGDTYPPAHPRCRCAVVPA